MKQDDSKPVFSFFSSLMIIGIGLSNFFIRKSKVPSLFNYIFFYSSNVGFLFLRFFSVLFFFYIIYKEKSIRKFLPLLFTYVVFIVLEEFIFIHGVFIYDFGDVSNFEGMGNVIGKLVSIGTTKLNLQTNEAWIIASQIKLLISKTAFFVDFYFVIYNIVLFFIISGKTTLDVLVHGIEIQLLFMIPFGIVELLYIWGFSWANVLVENIFVKLYDIGSNTTWWPPIHWPGMRNIFGESSFLVVYCSISIPFLLYYAFHKKKIIYFI